MAEGIIHGHAKLVSSAHHAPLKKPKYIPFERLAGSDIQPPTIAARIIQNANHNPATITTRRPMRYSSPEPTRKTISRSLSAGIAHPIIDAARQDPRPCRDAD